MYICVCNAITDQDIEKIRSQSPRMPWNEVVKKLGLGSECGTCIQNAIRELDDSAPIAAKTGPSKNQKTRA